MHFGSANSNTCANGGSDQTHALAAAFADSDE
jgi:hypothetical protein